MTTSYSLPMPGKCRVIHLTAASDTLPTDIVLVSRMGVSSSPHSWTWVRPETSPAPLSTKAPAIARCSKIDEPARTAVTPVRTGPLPTMQGALALDQGRVADPDALHVGDGVARARRQPPQRETQVA